MKWNKKVLRALRSSLASRKGRKHGTKRTHNQKSTGVKPSPRPRVLLARLKQKWQREHKAPMAV